MARMTEEFTFEDLPSNEGYPELTWPGKHPLRSTTWRPALLRESYGLASDGWMNKLYRGDNLQVMAHLLGDFRSKVDLVYIDPPFGSNANYGSLVHPKGRPAYPLLFTFGKTRFSDIWARDEYLQFMYERLILIRELLSEKGSLFVHCDRCSQHLLRCLLDEIFGADVEKESAPGLVNEIIWHHSYTPVDPDDRFVPGHDTIFWYSKTLSAPPWTVQRRFRTSTSSGTGRCTGSCPRTRSPPSSRPSLAIANVPGSAIVSLSKGSGLPRRALSPKRSRNDNFSLFRYMS